MVIFELRKDLLSWNNDACFGGGGFSIKLYGYSLDFGISDFKQVKNIRLVGRWWHSHLAALII